MKIGDTFTDGQKRTWAVGECLGRGLWGRTWLVRPAGGDDQGARVLKVALGPEDFPSDAPVPREVPEACRDACMEQARLLERAEHPFLPRLEGVVTLPDGRPGLLLTRYPTTLQRRLEGALPLTSAVQLVVTLTEQLAKAGRVHGNLRPSNVLLNDRGEPVLTDLVTPAAARLLERLEGLAQGRTSWRPPEGGKPSGGWDTWALCQVLWQSAMTREAEATQRLDLPVDGLDKVALATLKDRALGRLGHERTNPRFRARLADRLAAVLNRGLSRFSEPSPPYRFVDAGTLLPRIQEVLALVDPRVDEVGRVLLGPDADASGVFGGGQTVDFTVSVSCTAGVTDHDDVVCGLQLLDLDAPGERRVRLPDAGFRVTTHPSGRLRYRFTLPEVPPGRYRVRTAFSVRDSGHEPQVADGAFEVRPPPGYVPPAEREDPASKAPLAFPGRPARADAAPATPAARTPAPSPDRRTADRPGPRIHAPVDTVDEAADGGTDATVPAARPEPSDDASPYSDPGSFSDPGAEIIEGFFPRPVAPPEEPVAVAPPAQVEVGRAEVSAATGHGAAFRTQGAPTAVTEATAPYLGPSPTQAPPAGFRVPTPTIAMPRPPGAPAPPAPTPRPAPERAPGPPADAFDWDRDIDDWDDAPGDGSDFGIHHGALPPGGGEDLPTWRSAELPFDPKSIPGVARVIELVQRDSYTAFALSVAACFLLVLFIFALARAC